MAKTKVIQWNIMLIYGTIDQKLGFTFILKKYIYVRKNIISNGV